MIELTKINDCINFDEPTHVYTKNGKKFTSVTTMLSFFKNKFDPQGHIARAVAKRDGIDVKEVLSNWDKTKVEGLVRGRNFHRQAEHFIKTGEILDEDYKDVIIQLKDFDFNGGKLFSEIGLHSDEFEIAGCCDLIELIGDKNIATFDFKSNKKLTTFSKYKTKLLYPLTHLDECDLTIYSLQIGIYNRMLEDFGYKSIDKSKILHINPETRKIDVYPIMPLKDEVNKLLKHFKSMMDF